MDVDQQPLVEQIRNQKRNELKLDQKSHRKKELDRNRAGLGELHHSIGVIEHISEHEIKGLAGRIKRRKRCEPLDLVRLSYGFQQSRENISHFVRITGAINVIVKELTGHDYNLQLLAAECLCNLSLGDDICCEKIASFAGTYLIALSENPNFRPLQQTCLWTLQNIVGSSSKGAKVLFSQGLVVILIRLLSTTADQEAADDIIMTLELALNYEQENEATLARIVKCFVGKVLHPSSLRLLHKCYNLMPTEQHLHESSVEIIHGCLNFLSSVTGTHLHPQAAPILLSVRILAHHVVAGQQYVEEIFRYLVQQQQQAVKFSVLFNGCAAEELLPVCKELLWFLGQLHTDGANSEGMKLYLSFDNFVEQLSVPRALL
uniref:IBB domain-containing protein n=1 Tax=Anopheles atroparvus TaxID=41427 RepID=A0AAG5D9Z9_ANOAO